MARLTKTHPSPVVSGGPFARPAGILSFAQASDVILASRVQLTGAQAASEMHDMIATATRGISWNSRSLGPDIALDVMAGKRQDLALHDDHMSGLSSFLLDAADTIGVPGVARSGHCAHCGGSGQSLPLWERGGLGKP
ncbi:hypothetical protein ACIA8H_33175 [Streptomyces goshikiensis]|uniref:hypothetical protein n=1 Tax=Streptomyces goshikiensis TaxID=1942 RepID=UPI00379E30BA